MDSLIADTTAAIGRWAKDARVRANVDLVNHLRKVHSNISNEPSSIVTFVSDDKSTVFGIGALLRERSKKLKEIIDSLEEGEQCVMPFSRQVLNSIFEFLYTGDIVYCVPSDWKMGFQIIEAAEYLSVKHNVEFLVWESLLFKSFSFADNMVGTAENLNTFVEFHKKCVIDENISSLVSTLLVKTLSSRFLFPGELHSLSAEAFGYLLSKTIINYNSENAVEVLEDRDLNGDAFFDEEDKAQRDAKPIERGNDDPLSLSFKPYLQLRQVIIWCAVSQTQTSSTLKDIESLVNGLVPDEKTAALLWTERYLIKVGDKSPAERSNLSGDHEFRVSLLEAIFPDKKAKTLVVSMLSKIDLRCIHPLLLLKFVEPLYRILMVVSPEEMTAMFLFHAFRVPMSVKTPSSCSWDHDKSYLSYDDGLVIEKVASGIQSAWAELPVGGPTAMCRAYEWSITVESLGASFLEIGFLPKETELDDDQPLSYNPSARVIRFEEYNNITKMNHPHDHVKSLWTYCKSLLQEGSTVRFHLDTSQRSCRIFIDDVEETAKWLVPPHYIYYPAVCLGHSPGGRVRIELLNGFEYL